MYNLYIDFCGVFMYFYSDLHIHSKYSRATSKNCNLEELAIWAKKKGLSVISTGDFTHPAWFSEIKEKLVPAGAGVFRLRRDIEEKIFNGDDFVRFILSVEISTIYKKWEKTRKVHHVVFMPDLKSAELFRQKLSAIGNIKSDGRPILGLDSRNLLEIVLESGEGAYIIPAHIWTPWFSVLGSKSGFDSIEECYDDLSEHIFAVETGLSSDPRMNWSVSKLDRFRLVSNSDAHSPSKLAREATVFNTELDYFSIMNALKTGEGYVGTVEFFPEEGKYHEDGHRKCNICLTPEETKSLNGICPVCHKPLTIGVLYRVNELADRSGNFNPPVTAGKVFSLVPLPEIISEIMQVGVSSKSVEREYERIINKLGSELSILTKIPVKDISGVSELLGEAISRLRSGRVIKQAGYDGEYGVIQLFEPGELVKKKSVNLKLALGGFEESSYENQKQDCCKQNISVDKTDICPVDNNISIEETNSYGLDKYQQAAVDSSACQLLIVAGPGSGKTTVLTRRICSMILSGKFKPENCLAITFTKRAANEMRERLAKLLSDKSNLINIHTFHSLCFEILKENYEKVGLDENFRVMSEQEMLLYKDKDLACENIISFDELINLTVQLLDSYPEVLCGYRDKFKYVSVDEYQDIDENQYKLIRLLVPEFGNICAIGDPNQAIYGFRGGDSKFFNNFELDYSSAKLISLKNNYRSSGNIVNASNQMIDSFNIVSKYVKPQEKITIHTAPTDKSEAEFIASTIENLIGGHSLFSIDSERSMGQECSYSFSDFAILYRTSSQLPALVEALQRTGMPFVVLSNKPICEQKSVHNLLCRLQDNMSVYEQIKALSIEFAESIDCCILNYLQKLSQTCESKEQFLHEVSMLTEIDTLDVRADRIVVMSLHSSKGLEFKCVFVAGLEKGILPLYKAETEENIEEERRLLYVGMTRAKDRLYLSRAIKRKWLGTYRNLPISPFLERIEAELLSLSKYEKDYGMKDNVTQLSLF